MIGDIPMNEALIILLVIVVAFIFTSPGPKDEPPPPELPPPAPKQGQRFIIEIPPDGDGQPQIRR